MSIERQLAIGVWGLGLGSVWIVTFGIGLGLAMFLPGSDATGARQALPAGLVAWGVAGGAVTLLVARAAHDAWPERLGPPFAILAAACAAGVAAEVTVMRWATERFGSQAGDPDLIGWTAALAPLVVLVGLVTVAARTMPSPGHRFARAATVIAAAAVVFVVATNVPGAMNGVTRLAIPMGVAMAGAAVVVVAAVVVACRPGGMAPER